MVSSGSVVVQCALDGGVTLFYEEEPSEHAVSVGPGVFLLEDCLLET